MSLSFTREDLVKARHKNVKRLQDKVNEEVQKVKNHFLFFIEEEYKRLDTHTLYSPQQYEFEEKDKNKLGIITLSSEEIREVLRSTIQQTREELKIKIAWCFGGASDGVITASVDFFSDIEREE